MSAADVLADGLIVRPPNDNERELSTNALTTIQVIFAAASLDKHEAWLLAAIAVRVGTKSIGWQALSQLAADTKIPVRTVTRTISRLEERSLLIVIRGGEDGAKQGKGGANTYQVDVGAIRQLARPNKVRRHDQGSTATPGHHGQRPLATMANAPLANVANTKTLIQDSLKNESGRERTTPSSPSVKEGDRRPARQWPGKTVALSEAECDVIATWQRLRTARYDGEPPPVDAAGDRKAAASLLETAHLHAEARATELAKRGETADVEALARESVEFLIGRFLADVGTSFPDTPGGDLKTHRHPFGHIVARLARYRTPWSRPTSTAERVVYPVVVATAPGTRPLTAAEDAAARAALLSAPARPWTRRR